MNFSLYLALKYFKLRAGERGISAMAVISLLTIVISCTAAVVILSASNGMHQNFLDKILAKDAHILFIGKQQGIENYEPVISNMQAVAGVRSVMPYYEKQALIKGQLNLFGAMIMGIPADTWQKDPDFPAQFKFEQGSFNLSQPMSLLLGYNLAQNIGAFSGSMVSVTVYSEQFFSLSYNFKVTGVFSAGNKDYDSSLAMISFMDAQKLFGKPGTTYGLAVKLKDPLQSEFYQKKLSAYCSAPSFTWQSLHRSDLQGLQDEKMLLFIVLVFFFIVVGFNILSMMVGMVLDKKVEIGIMKALGLTPQETRNAFLLNGFFMGILGSLAGIFLGVLTTLTLNNILKGIEKLVNTTNYLSYHLVSLFHKVPQPEPFEFFNASVYYITQFPLKMEYGDLLFLFLLSAVLSTLAVLIPAANAAKLRPVEVLRND